MASLVPTLARLVEQADQVYADGRLPAARRAYEDLVQRAQDKVDRSTEVVARSMLAVCLLRLREAHGAREQLSAAGRLVDPERLDVYARYRMALIRLAVEEGPPDAARAEAIEYLRWAEDHRRPQETLDACLVLAAASEPEERVEWLDRGIAQVGDGPVHPLGRAWTELASALDLTGRSERALDAYQQAARWFGHHGRPRDQLAAGWAVGALAVRLEEWPLARTTLEQVVGGAERRSDCDDLMALALADLAQVYEAAGDVVDARHTLIRAMQRARQEQLDAAWPDRWAAMVAHARRLELED
ncbi:MAG: hypothetical protein ABMA64_22700 [Myxococcota bacterium]